MDSLICNGGFSDTIIEILTIIGWFIFGYGVALIARNAPNWVRTVFREIKKARTPPSPSPPKRRKTIDGVEHEESGAPGAEGVWIPLPNDDWKADYGWFHWVKLSIIISTVVYGLFLIVSAV